MRYNEVNVHDRKDALKRELGKWGNNVNRFKEYREQWNKAAMQNYLPSLPLHMDIELSDACNLRCKMCVHGIGTMKNVGFMDKDLALKIPFSGSAAHPADLNQDGQVNAADLLLMLGQWLGGGLGDFNSDQKVNSLDFGFILGDWGL